MIRHRLVTNHTSATRVLVKKLMTAKCLKIRRETYFCILFDSLYGGPIVMVSPNGSSDIEEMYRNNDMITVFSIDVKKGITKQLAFDIATCLQFSDNLHDKVYQQITSIWNLFKEIDAIQIKVNPLVETENDEIVAVDTKIKFDNNILYRQNNTPMGLEEITEDLDEQDLKDFETNLNYIGLDGDITSTVHKIDLAMATMDILKVYEDKPKNFLAVGGGNENELIESTKLLISDNCTKSLLIYDGIVDYTFIANGIIRTVKLISVFR